MAEQTNYAMDTAQRLNEIGFADFTSDLVTKTFEAIIDANLRQTESYIDLVKELTKSLQVYINETKLEISNQEVLDHLGSLPPFTSALGAPIMTVATTPAPVTLTAGETVPATGLNAINQQFTAPTMVTEILKVAQASGGVSGLLKDVMGLVKSVVPSVNPPAGLFPIAEEPDYYSPDVFDTWLNTQNDPPGAEISETAVGKLYDAVAEVIAGDKYALLQEMVKLGVMRLVVERGVITAGLSFTTWERSSQTSSQYDKHKEEVKSKYKQKSPRSRGILAQIRARPIEKTRNKQRDLRVQTSSQNTSASQGTTITITGGVEIHFRTDYLPVAQA